jgi:hypothetical protein
MTRGLSARENNVLCNSGTYHGKLDKRHNIDSNFVERGVVGNSRRRETYMGPAMPIESFRQHQHKEKLIIMVIILGTLLRSLKSLK